MSNRTEQGASAGNPGDRDVDELVRRAQAGEMAAFDELVRIFQVPMFNLAYRMVNNREDADDLTQEIFVKMYRAIGKFRGQSKFSTWLYALAANTCRSGLRKLRRVSSFEVVRLDEEKDTEFGPKRHDAVDPGALPDETVKRRETRTRIEAVIASLPHDFRAVIVMRELQGLSYEEVASALKCSIGTVKSRLSRARNMVKEKLTREGVICAVAK